ncbi:efflux RND transporter permease subunit [Fimbriiglobus ruber]|uniref:RND efflux system, inner membrane transporter CmeB n=1 Tax=Fimbriiglobus ruber TaxID=1908690 RepID=A0A225D9R1_9BACT|nr:multidrug efflux RND transporter permease subunit [Fimbriiglobus ruber]OWK37713.1 RND efflux system, inner membrane transporter CmeB [Fimbriiglobus ruber]
MFAVFFIRRPVFAAVIALSTVLAGVLSLTALPIAQYPDVVPPQVVVTASYPGANATVVSETVASPIEEQVNGVEDMLYMESQCTNDGSMRLTITFKTGTDPDKAQVLVQNRVAIATPKLPDTVRTIGVTTKKQSTAILLAVSLFSPNDPKTGKPKQDQLKVSNYARLQVKDDLARIDGVGDVATLGEREYSMRVWLDPNKMADVNLTAAEVASAIRAQNQQVAAGQIGQQPSTTGQSFQLVINTQGRLPDAAAFGEIVVKAGDGSDGEQLIHIKDVGRVELGARSYDSTATTDGRPAVTLPIFQLPGANAFRTATLVREKMKALRAQPGWPDGIEYAIVFDPTTFVQASVEAVVQTLFEAIVLVAIVVLVFLQNWRAALIPMLAVPVALIGSLAAMLVLGYSINNLTLFGMVLAIGIVVDDAIVVVEAVEVHIARGLAPVAATERAMGEVAGAVIGVSLVLTAVFLPSAVLPGLTGQFFRQFAVTVAVATILSAINSLTLTPALCPLLLRPHGAGGEHHEGEAKGRPAVRKDALPALGIALLIGYLVADLIGGHVAGLVPAGWPKWAGTATVVLVAAIPGYFLAKPINLALGWFFVGFNWAFERATGAYGWAVGKLIRISVVVLLVYVGLLALTGVGFGKVPGGFIPQQDQGYLVINAQLPDGASLPRTEAVMKKVTDMCLGELQPDGTRVGGIEGIQHIIAFPGYSVFASANISNAGGAYVSFTPFEQRKGRHADAILADLNRKLATIAEGQVTAFGAPPILGLGNAGGFKLQIQDRNNYGPGVLEGMTWNLIGQVAKDAETHPGIVGSFSTYRSGAPQLFVSVDRERCQKMGVSVQSVNDTLQIYLGSLYVNDVTLESRNWQVNVQADAQFRDQEEDIGKLKVRAPSGMVPIAGLIDIKRIDGPTKVNRYQMIPAADVNGFTIPAFISSAQALDKMETLAKRELPPGMTYEWTDMAYQQKLASNTRVEIPGVFAFNGDTTILVFGLSILAAFLVLSALYESWLLPLAVVLIVPMCLFSALIGLLIVSLDLNIFTQIGLVVLVGLASKNAILIVEFAKQKREAGEPRFDAAVDAARQRLRPILMTSFAFILGVLPLVVAEGAGAEMRRALGTAVFSGMIGVTVFGIFFTPVFYVVLQRFRDRGGESPPPAEKSGEVSANGHNGVLVPPVMQDGNKVPAG